jgi:hypothetical protein
LQRNHLDHRPVPRVREDQRRVPYLRSRRPHREQARFHIGCVNPNNCGR